MKKVIPGIILCAGLGAAAYGGADYTALGSVTLVLLAGIFLGNLLMKEGRLRDSLFPGIGFCEKRILTWAIALMGVNLDYRILKGLGPGTLILIPASLLFTVSLALVLGKLFGQPGKLSLLMGIGNAVCGSSAIAAAQGVVEAEEKHVALSVVAVNLFGTVGIFLLPLLAGFFFGSDPAAEGILIGNTLQAIGQVTAAGFSVSEITGQTATVVKMGRILLIGPVVMLLSLRFSRSSGKGARRRWFPGIPAYIIVFLLFSLAGSLDLLPGPLAAAAGLLSKLLLVTAMAAVGLKISLRDLVKSESSAVTMGIATVAGQISFSLLMIRLLCA
jgi:uncharacterized integral membrane protein (TIGR00698 family)